MVRRQWWPTKLSHEVQLYYFRHEPNEFWYDSAQPTLLAQTKTLGLRPGRYVMMVLVAGSDSHAQFVATAGADGVVISTEMEDGLKPYVATRCTVTFTPKDRGQDRERSPSEILKQATACWSAYRALAPDPDEQLFVINYSDAAGRTAQAHSLNASMDNFLAIAGRLRETYPNLPEQKLLTYIRMAPEEMRERPVPSLYDLVNAVSSISPDFNYEAMDTAGAIRLAADFGVLVKFDSSLQSYSSLVRCYRNGALERDVIVVREKLRGIQKVFFILYELCHLLAHVSSVTRLPAGADGHPLLSLQCGDLPRDAHAMAEMFALIGLIPTPELAWKLKAWHGMGASSGDFCEQDENLHSSVETAMVNCLAEDNRLDLNSLKPEKLRAVFRRNLASRATTYLRYTRARGQRPLDILPRRALDEAEVQGFVASSLHEDKCWAQIDLEGQLTACSKSYAALLGRQPRELIGHNIRRFADRRTEQRFQEAAKERAESLTPTQYFFCFNRNGLALPRLVCHVVAWPICSGTKIVGALGLVRPVGISHDALHRGATNPIGQLHDFISTPNSH